jgi:hypothetical protein
MLATRPSKATPAEIRLDDYAHAEVRSREVWDATAKRCADCPGPESPGGCASRPFTAAVAGRADWPLCPRGLTRVRAWRALVNRYIDAQIAPLAGFPHRYKPWVTQGFRALRQAIRDEDARGQKAADRPAGLPRYAGRRNVREGA